MHYLPYASDSLLHSLGNDKIIHFFLKLCLIHGNQRIIRNCNRDRNTMHMYFILMVRYYVLQILFLLLCMLCNTAFSFMPCIACVMYCWYHLYYSVILPIFSSLIRVWWYRIYYHKLESNLVRQILIGNAWCVQLANPIYIVYWVKHFMDSCFCNVLPNPSPRVNGDLDVNHAFTKI